MRLRAHVRGPEEQKAQQSIPLHRAILEDWERYGVQH